MICLAVVSLAGKLSCIASISVYAKITPGEQSLANLIIVS